MSNLQISVHFALPYGPFGLSRFICVKCAELIQTFRTAEQIYTFQFILTPSSPLLIPGILAVAKFGPNKLLNIKVASIANAIVNYLYFHSKSCQTVANSGTGLKQLCVFLSCACLCLQDLSLWSPSRRKWEDSCT